MEREYNIFECYPDGSVAWRDVVEGLAKARQRLRQFAEEKKHEHFAMHLPTRDAVFLADAGRDGGGPVKRVFQIAYMQKLGIERAQILRGFGYGVLSANGNEAAKEILNILGLHSTQISLFLVGHAAPLEVRSEMIAWLKANYPGVKILALNPPTQQLDGADYNVLQNGLDAWLPLLDQI